MSDSETIIANLCQIALDVAPDDAVIIEARDLERLADPDEVPVTVAELRDTDNQPIWRVTNAAKTVLYAWVDARGWECTGWALGSFLDDVEPITGRDDVPRGQWPVGLATLVAKSLADIESEPDTWGET